ncbi:MAG TPA: type II toxin-antitoxin system VapC family toxin [Thermoanaerobaculia bacterium]|nr:type II toxin-antitoxin system VapC family toxin [Thermoanaerobaculia bacterium]
MILDSSAIVAILREEPGFKGLLARLRETDVIGVGAPTLLETSIVLRNRLGPWGEAALDRFLAEYQITIIPFGEDHWHEAADAHRRFGKGRHPAALNLGDCLAYATAKLAGRPLLFTGADFSKTDLLIAESPPPLP